MSTQTPETIIHPNETRTLALKMKVREWEIFAESLKEGGWALAFLLQALENEVFNNIERRVS